MRAPTILLLLPALLAAAGPRSAPPGPTECPAPGPVGFLDADGDGLNDLAADRDGDGLPDRLEACGDTLSLRWASLRAVPDSVAADSQAFGRWWSEAGDGAVPPARAWESWRAWTRPVENCACGCQRCRCLH